MSATLEQLQVTHRWLLPQPLYLLCVSFLFGGRPYFYFREKLEIAASYSFCKSFFPNLIVNSRSSHGAPESLPLDTSGQVFSSFATDLSTLASQSFLESCWACIVMQVFGLIKQTPLLGMVKF